MRIFIPIVLVNIFILGCSEDELFPKRRNYPILQINEVENLDEKGVTISATVLDPGIYEVVDYGFRWSTRLTEFRYSTKDINDFSDLKLRITSDLIEDSIYFYFAFVEVITDFDTKLTIWSDVFSFQSKGSGAPAVTDFFPKTISSGDTLTLTGQNFSVSLNRTKVRLDSTSTNIISLDFDEIKVRVPILEDGERSINLTSGKQSLTLQDKIIISN